MRRSVWLAVSRRKSILAAALVALLVMAPAAAAEERLVAAPSQLGDIPVVSPDGEWVVFSDGNFNVFATNPRLQDPVFLVSGTMLAFSPDSRAALVATGDEVQLLDLASATEIWSSSSSDSDRYGPVEWSAAGDRVLIGGNLHDAKSGVVVASVPDPTAKGLKVLAQADSKIAYWGEHGGLRLLDVASGSVTTVVNAPSDRSFYLIEELGEQFVLWTSVRWMTNEDGSQVDGDAQVWSFDRVTGQAYLLHSGNYQHNVWDAVVVGDFVFWDGRFDDPLTTMNVWRASLDGSSPSEVVLSGYRTSVHGATKTHAVLSSWSDRLFVADSSGNAVEIAGGGIAVDTATPTEALLVRGSEIVAVDPATLTQRVVAPARGEVNCSTDVFVVICNWDHPIGISRPPYVELGVLRYVDLTDPGSVIWEVNLATGVETAVVTDPDDWVSNLSRAGEVPYRYYLRLKTDEIVAVGELPAVVVDSFADDNGSIFEQDIEWLAASGITKGCNPPTNNLFCPDRTVTRGQMAAFLHRALPDLPEVRPAIDFTDDDESIFEADIEWLYSRGVTEGTSATTFAPDRPVTRGQMAAFLVRALKYSDNGGGDLFIDDDTSQFAGDIDRLGTAGVTRGCNPPTNDRFCPDGFVTRGQMAAFLHRALGD